MQASGDSKREVLPFYFAEEETGPSKLNNLLSIISLGKCQPLNYIKFAWLSALNPMFKRRTACQEWYTCLWRHF